MENERPGPSPRGSETSSWKKRGRKARGDPYEILSGATKGVCPCDLIRLTYTNLGTSICVLCHDACCGVLLPVARCGLRAHASNLTLHKRTTLRVTRRWGGLVGALSQLQGRENVGPPMHFARSDYWAKSRL